MVSAGTVKLNPLETPWTLLPVVDAVAVASGVPSAQVYASSVLLSCVGVPLPMLVRLLICCVTPVLWSKLVALESPQCAQSPMPSAVRLIVPDGVDEEPERAPLPPTL